ncbi:DUF1553 domain-containing protein [Paludisphaera rhizosphaerae]|uniref:DUF1553 domain-containing protein n=1 Tax=Paludisphaera rhizosphaerae TaxID=2711216 RepID=UPI0013EA32EA|nr:DUF1553 domain-containing protein [Paludisphaera rhizosphaerae]
MSGISGLARLAATALAALAGVSVGLAQTPVEDRLDRTVPAETSVVFAKQVAPLLSRGGCNAVDCHGSSKGKGGLSLSLFGGDATLDHEAFTADAHGRRIDRVEPARSLMILKATGQVEHGGKRRFEPSSPEAALLTAWIAQGARLDDPRLPGVVALEVTPRQAVFAPGSHAQVKVTAVLTDGARRDVTREAVVRSSDPKVATVDADGSAKAVAPGQAAVSASYQHRFGSMMLVVPRDLPGGFPDVRPANVVDDAVLARLRLLGIPPSETCDDATFLRRVSLDVTGRLPSPEEVVAFLDDSTADKRARLIDRLLASEDFVDFQTMKWGDLLRIKSEYPSRLWPKAVASYTRYIRESIAADKPYDQFVRELLTAYGSNFRDGPANYCRAAAGKNPQTFADATALVFLGKRTACARCHAHPDDSWTQDDELAFAAFFARVGFKPSNEWKEEVVYYNPKGVVRDPRTNQVVAPRLPGGQPLTFGPDEDPRRTLAEWMTSPADEDFARAIANRVWFWLLGRGIVHEPDDFRPSNPPSQPELLDRLAYEVVASRYDLKHLFRLILNSKTYQASSKTRPENADDFACFSHHVPRRLSAEQLLDAFVQITGTPEKFTSRIPEPFTILPPDTRAVQLTDGNIEESPFPFLELFGRPARDTPYERERDDEPTLRQALYLANSDHLESKIAASAVLKQMLDSHEPDAATVERLYLATLSRRPSEAERKAAVDLLTRDPKVRPQALRDLLWALFNTKEFLFNR